MVRGNIIYHTHLYAVEQPNKTTGPATEKHGEDGQVDSGHTRLNSLPWSMNIFRKNNLEGK